MCVYIHSYFNTVDCVQPIDSKREEYRKYLEKTGALDSLTKVLLMLYEETEKPTDSLEYPL